MSDLLHNKTAVITAAGQGIGRAVAEAFRDHGANVVATDRDPELVASIKDVTSWKVDVTSSEDIASCLAAYPPDILFNCAGWVHCGSILDCSDDAWDLSFDVNVTSMFRTIKIALPGMIERGSGSIINMSSVASSVIGVPDRFAYGATKAAVIGLTKSIAADFVSHGIRCNAICPGTVLSPSLEQRLRDTGNFAAALEAFKERQPMGRLGTPEEIAALAVYLASDLSSFTTGQTHIIDGGWSNS